MNVRLVLTTVFVGVDISSRAAENGWSSQVDRFCVNPFSPTLKLIVAKMNLPKHSVP